MQLVNREQPQEMQLDLVEHSRDVVLRKRAIEAARAYDPSQLARELDSLVQVCPADPLLPPLNTVLTRISVPLSLQLPRQVALEVLRMTEQTIPTADRVFGDMAERWLARLWEDLAAAIAGLSYGPGCEHIYAAPLLLRARSWVKARESVEAIHAWRRQPAPLAWRTESEFHQSGLISAWPYLVELCWMAPKAATLLAARLQGNELSDLVRDFQMQYEGDGDDRDFAWLPAWSVIAEPRWAAAVRQAQPGTNSPAERFARQVLELFTLERQGRHSSLVAGRRILRDINPALFALYMRSR